MEDDNNSIVGKELGIFCSKFNKFVKVGSIKLSKEDLISEKNFVSALEKVTSNLENRTYNIHKDDGLFAKFDIENKKIKLHAISESTGVIMPCWNCFK